MASACAAFSSVYFGTTMCRGGGLIYHALNRVNGRLAIFDSDPDYAAFERVLEQDVASSDIRCWPTA